MKAKILPLEEKYYKTEIQAEHKGDRVYITLGGGGRPISDRQWINWDFEEDEDVINDLCADGHYESSSVYEVAGKIVQMLNNDNNR